MNYDYCWGSLKKEQYQFTQNGSDENDDGAD